MGGSFCPPSECSAPTLIFPQKRFAHFQLESTKKKDPCSQKYIREESLATGISEILQKVSLNSDWADDMIQMLDKDKQDTAQSDAIFAQKIKKEILEHDEKLEKLLDLNLSNEITKKEYSDKKQKILNQKIDIQEKLRVFEQKGNRWLERTRKYILDAKQAKIIALHENLFDKKDFLKKIGSNPTLRDRDISLNIKNDWKILINFNSEFQKSRQKIPNFQIRTMKLRRLDSNQQPTGYT